MIKFTKIIKRLAVSALLTNTICASESPELPKDHPIRTAVEMSRCVLWQEPWIPGDLCRITHKHFSRQNISEHIQPKIKRAWAECINTLFLIDEGKNVFLAVNYLKANVDKQFLSAIAIDVSALFDEIYSELDTYIHQSFDRHFQIRRDKGEYAAAYNIAQVYRDHNTEHEENLAKANGWINEIKTQAREHVKEIGEVIYALFLERGLQAKQISKATLIIESFKEVAPAFREELEKILHDTAHKKRTFDPIAAERLIVYREMADALFNCDDV